MDKKWGILELISYSRHDWLNKVQLIKGNLELDKMDYVKEIIDNMIREAKNEAELSNLQMPKMAELLITSKWRDFVFSLEYEVLHIVKGCQKVDESMYNWTVAFINYLNISLDSLVQNEMKIIIFESESSIRFTFDLQGKIKNRDVIDTFFKEKCPSLSSMSIISFTDEELVFDIEWDYKAQ